MTFRSTSRGPARRGATLAMVALLAGAFARGDTFRVKTDRGAFLVEVNAPDVKVRGDGIDLVVSREGGEDVRLRLPAERNPRASSEPVLAIDRDGKPIVTVRRAAAPPIPPTQDGPGRTVLRADRFSPAWSLAITDDGRTLVSGHRGAIRVWDLPDAVERFHVDTDGREVRKVTVTPDGATIASAEYTQVDGKQVGHVYIRDGKTGAARVVTGAVTTGLHCVALAPDGKVAVTSSWGAPDLLVWDAEKGDQAGALKGHTGAVGMVAYSPDGKTLASVGDTTVRLWDVDTGAIRRILRGHQKGLEGVGFSRDGKTLASGGFDNTARVWDPATGRAIATFELDEPVLSVALSVDGKLVAAAAARWGSGFYGASPAEVRVYDVARKAPVATLPHQPNQVFAMLFTPDGKTLATASLSGAVTLWDLATFRDTTAPTDDAPRARGR